MSRQIIVLDAAEDELIAAERLALCVRQVIVKPFPYSVIFIEHQSGLWVVAFAHQSRRPGYWRNRLGQ
jgi:hypothetical protein